MAKLSVLSVLNVLILLLGTKSENAGRGLQSKTPSLTLIDNLRAENLKTWGSLWQDITDSTDANSQRMSDMEVLLTFEKLSKNITKAEDFINGSDNYLFLSERSYALIDAEIFNINTYFETFLTFQKENLKEIRKPPAAWKDLTETYLQKSDYGVRKSLEKIHRYAATNSASDNLFNKVSKEINTNVCNLKQSPHQIIYNLYSTVALAELKANTILQFSYMILTLYNKENLIAEANLAQIKYLESGKRQLIVAKNVLMDADRTIYRCDPKEFVDGVTYTKLTKLLQGYIENEVNLNPYGTCSENCDYYEFAEYNGCFQDQFCSLQPECRGRVLECTYVDSDMNICRSSNSIRRYDWIEYENGKVLGNKEVCERKNLFKVDSWWRYLFWHCSYCLCLCDDSQNSDRYFNLRDVTSDIDKNKVVTGVRLVKNNQIIHLQIQQGVLLERGMIDKNTISWKPVDNYTIDDNVESNVDYHIMSWLERTLDIDTIFGPPEYVVTGVRFRKLGSHLNLEIRLSAINFVTGKLLRLNRSYWQGNENTDASFDRPRSEIKLNNPDVPTRKGPHTLNSKHDQYIQFQASSFDTDAAQTTVPFIDTQDLVSGGFVLSGIGLIHRGAIGSGGFIAPKLISYNFVPHLNEKLNF